MSYLLQSRVQCRALSLASTLRTTSSRSFTLSRRAMVQASEISPSQGESIDTLVSQTTALVDSGRWILCNDGKGLERQFKFRTFKATWVFDRVLSVPQWPLLICMQGLHEQGGGGVQEAEAPPGMDECFQQDAHSLDNA